MALHDADLAMSLLQDINNSPEKRLKFRDAKCPIRTVYIFQRKGFHIIATRIAHLPPATAIIPVFALRPKNEHNQSTVNHLRTRSEASYY